MQKILYSTYATSAQTAKYDVNARRQGTHGGKREDKQCRRGKDELNCEGKELSVWASVMT